MTSVTVFMNSGADRCSKGRSKPRLTAVIAASIAEGHLHHSRFAMGADHLTDDDDHEHDPRNRFQDSCQYRGRKSSLTPEQADDLRKWVASGGKKAVLAREFGISRDTVYQYLHA